LFLYVWDIYLMLSGQKEFDRVAVRSIECKGSQWAFGLLWLKKVQNNSQSVLSLTEWAQRWMVLEHPKKSVKGSQFGFGFTPITSHLEPNVIDRNNLNCFFLLLSSGC
jgi:hypothetical protein